MMSEPRGEENWKHPNDMTREELRDIVSAMSWMALDLAQHLVYVNDLLKDELKPDAYKKAERMAYELERFPYYGPRDDSKRTPGIAVFGAKGLEGWS